MTKVRQRVSVGVTNQGKATPFQSLITVEPTRKIDLNISTDVRDRKMKAPIRKSSKNLRHFSVPLKTIQRPQYPNGREKQEDTSIKPEDRFSESILLNRLQRKQVDKKKLLQEAARAEMESKKYMQDWRLSSNWGSMLSRYSVDKDYNNPFEWMKKQPVDRTKFLPEYVRKRRQKNMEVKHKLNHIEGYDAISAKMENERTYQALCLQSRSSSNTRYHLETPYYRSESRTNDSKKTEGIKTRRELLDYRKRNNYNYNLAAFGPLDSENLNCGRQSIERELRNLNNIVNEI